MLLQEKRSWRFHVNFMTLLASTGGGGGVVGVAYGVLGPPAGGLLCQENLEVLSGRKSLREDIRILI
jgi:hypothetical protein